MMAIDRRKVLLYTSAAALRFLLFSSFPLLPDLLTGRAEISTPVTSFKRCTPMALLHWAFSPDFQCTWLKSSLLQYKKASFSTPTTSLPTMAACSTRRVITPRLSLSTILIHYVGTIVTTTIRSDPVIRLLPYHSPPLHSHGPTLYRIHHTNCRVGHREIITPLFFTTQRQSLGQPSRWRCVSWP